MPSLSRVSFVAATIVLLAHCLYADEPEAPIPGSFLEYFRRIDLETERARNESEAAVKELEIQEMEQSDPTKKAKTRKKLTAANALLAKVRRPDYRATIFIEDSKPGSIGVLGSCKIMRIIDKDTAVAEGPGTLYWIISDHPTTSLRPGKRERFDQPFRVVKQRTLVIQGRKSDDKHSLEGISPGFPYCVIEPIEPRDLRRYQMQYEAEKEKAKVAAEKAAAKDENPTP